MAKKSSRRLIKWINFYPPFLGMGIKVRSFADDFTRFEVQLRERWWNRNLYGTHFGGSLFAMADPFYMFVVAMNFGDGYIVWDKSAAIDFLKPGRGIVTGIFEISPQKLAAMRDEVDEHGKRTFHFETDLVNEQGEAVAHVNKEVYVRRKSREARPAQ